jgi:hypothetical protein
MYRTIGSRPIALVAAVFVRMSLSAAIAVAVSPLASLSEASSMERATISQDAPDQIVSDQEVTPLDAFGYLGGLIEARFYEPIRPRTVRTTKSGRRRICMAWM